MPKVESKSNPTTSASKKAGKEATMTEATATKETPTAETKVEPKPRPEPTLCLCGCGDYPLNPKSRFVPGHDAKLKGRIIKFLTAQANGKEYNAAKFGPTPTEEQMAYGHEKWDHLIDFSGAKYKKQPKPKAEVETAKAGVPDEAKVKKAAK